MPDIFLETERLIVRPFKIDETARIHAILDQGFGDGTKIDDSAALEERRSWVEWSILNQIWKARLYQPPYGEQAIIEKASGTLVGAVGFVPCLAPFEKFPELCDSGGPSGFFTCEFGLFWAIDPAMQRRGYATEAAYALIRFAFSDLHLKRIIATTEYDNLASQGVMRKLGMQILSNPQPAEPFWLQIVGLLQNPEHIG